MKNFLGGLAVGLILLFVAAFVQYNGVIETAEAPEPDVEIKLPPVEEKLDPIATLDGYKRTYSAALSRIAQDTADNMAAKQASRYRDIRAFHTRFGQEALTQHGEVRENICWVSGSNDSWETAYEVWKASPPHEYNRQVGAKYIGYARATAGNTSYYVVVYGSKP